MDEPILNPPDYLTPDWEPKGTLVHDWRRYVGDRTRSLWSDLPIEVRFALACDAQDMADGEHWD